jgi:hypothetical protein
MISDAKIPTQRQGAATVEQWVNQPFPKHRNGPRLFQHGQDFVKILFGSNAPSHWIVKGQRRVTE